MISITIEGPAHVVREEMRALMGLDRDAPADVLIIEDEPAKPTRKPRAAKTETPAKGKSDTLVEQAAPTPDKDAAKPSVTEASPAVDEPNRDLSEKAMRERITQYSAKAGPVALTEMQKAAGAPNGKFSEVMADPEALAKLDALLADAGF